MTRAIVLAMLLAVVAGTLTPVNSFVYSCYAFIGALFLNGLKMVVVPLIVSSIITAVIGVNGRELGTIGVKALVFYFITTALAVGTGMVLVNLIGPGINAPTELRELLSASSAPSGVGAASRDLSSFFLDMVPDNVVLAAVQGEFIGLIFFSFLFGIFASQLQGKSYTSLYDFWHASQLVIMRITQWVLTFTPIGVFALIAKVIAGSGLSAFVPMVAFFVTVVIGLCVHFFITQSLLLFFLSRINPVKHLQAMSPALFTAFSTASSLGTLPVTLTCVENRVGVSAKIARFVLPLGGTVNMDGTALYECVAVIFIAQLLGIQLTIATQITIAILALLTSIGVAGVPAASLVAISLIMSSVGLPLEAMGLLLITDRILDMMRTTVNVYGDSVGAAIIAKSEKEDLPYDLTSKLSK
ncbi:MAG: dicarboxylate/amino acid:cation symporter [Methylacidiphilales bacterium]|nr:dicarboxylate/amino acid:cation symporter [Candidatus Methylacidiphilales bacterium]